MIFVGTFALLALLTMIGLVTRVGDPVSIAWVGLAFIAGMLGALLMLRLLAPFRIEYAWFKYKSGIVGLAVARIGKHSADFDAFVQGLEFRIRAASGEG